MESIISSIEKWSPETTVNGAKLKSQMSKKQCLYVMKIFAAYSLIILAVNILL
jgi:hypothetical protein